MKSEEEYLDEIEALAGEHWCATPELFEILEDALRFYPDSPTLWTCRGRMIQLGDEQSPYKVEEALKSFEKAVSLDPTYAPAQVEIGFFHDVITDNFPLAESAFRNAIKLGAKIRAYEGLARVLAEMGKAKEALAVLESCPFEDDRDLLGELKREIENGEWGPSASQSQQ